VSAAPKKELELEEHATISAHLWHYGPDRRAEVLRRLGVPPEVWEAEDRRHTAAIGEELSREESGLAERFGATAGAVKRRLRKDNPPIESIGAAPEPHAAEAAPSAAAATPALVEEAPPPPPPPAPVPAAAPHPVEIPSFLRKQESPALSPVAVASPPAIVPPPVAPPGMASPAAPVTPEPLGTLPVFVLPRSVSIPFHPSTPAEPAAAAAEHAKAHAEAVQGPAKPARAAVGETVGPADLAAVMKRVLPFGGAPPANEPAAEQASSPAPAAAETAPPPRLSVEQYASLHEELRLAGDRAPEVLRRYGLTPVQKAAVDGYWQQQFHAQPTTFLAWERARATYRAWLLKQRGGSG
jgi:hypothetical protein